MNLKSLSNQSLLQSIKSLVSQERRLSLEILWHLREIESRRLFLDLGYSSLFDYCLHELKYSESQAQRRISSSRLLKELPDLEEKVKAGALSLTTLSQAQSFFKKEEKITEKAFSKEDKLEILESLEVELPRFGGQI